MHRPLLLICIVLAACAPAPEAALDPSRPAAVEVVGEGVLSTAANEYNPSLSPDGRTLVFARSQPDFRDAKILVSHLRGGGWSAPEPVPFADARYADSDPTFAPDGRTLYFISDRPAAGRDSTRRDLDLWRVARREGGGWGAPEHLGGAVNTPAQELGPAWHDGWLYFASSRGGRARMLDIYRARDTGTGFGAAEAVDQWNTAASESDPEFSRDGSVFLFWSDRPGSTGSADVFASRRMPSGWSAPAAVGGISSAAFDFTPSFSPDGRWIYFASTRADPAQAALGQSDLYRVRTPAVLP
jgi:WD40-like Beta Propeller Repeat